MVLPRPTPTPILLLHPHPFSSTGYPPPAHPFGCLVWVLTMFWSMVNLAAVYFDCCASGARITTCTRNGPGPEPFPSTPPHPYSHVRCNIFAIVTEFADKRVARILWQQCFLFWHPAAFSHIGTNIYLAMIVFACFPRHTCRWGVCCVCVLCPIYTFMAGIIRATKFIYKTRNGKSNFVCVCSQRQRKICAA